MHIDLNKEPTSKWVHPVQQSRQQALKAYCSNIYTVDLGKNQITQNRPKYQSPTDQSALTNITMCYYLGDDIETRSVFSMKWTHFT